jgi:hypothetical protein
MPVPTCGLTGGVVFRMDFQIGGAQQEKEESSLEEGSG